MHSHVWGRHCAKFKDDHFNSFQLSRNRLRGTCTHTHIQYTHTQRSHLNSNFRLWQHNVTVSAVVAFGYGFGILCNIYILYITHTHTHCDPLTWSLCSPGAERCWCRDQTLGVVSLPLCSLRQTDRISAPALLQLQSHQLRQVSLKGIHTHSIRLDR